MAPHCLTGDRTILDLKTLLPWAHWACPASSPGLCQLLFSLLMTVLLIIHSVACPPPPLTWSGLSPERPAGNIDRVDCVDCEATSQLCHYSMRAASDSR